MCTVRLRLGATRAKNFEREFAPGIICLGQSEVQSQGEGERRKKEDFGKIRETLGTFGNRVKLYF